MKIIQKFAQKGFTIVEVIIAVGVSTILAGTLFTVTLYYYANALQSQITTEMALESQVILTQLVDDIRLADSIASTNTISDTYAPTGGWMTNDPSNIIIIQSPALDSNRNIIYDTNTGSPYSNEFIYYSSGTNMNKRILKNVDAAGNTAVTTCPSANATATCPADRTFSKRLSNLTFTFYDASNVTTSDATLARSVSLNVDMSEKVFGKTLTLSNSTRTTLRNQ